MSRRPLSVGDARFALKSFDRLRDFKARGKAILFVSHSLNQVVSICDRAVLLEHGKIVAEGEPSAVGSIYHELLFGSPAIESVPAAGDDGEVPVIANDWDSMLNQSPSEYRYGDEQVTFTRAAILTPEGEPVRTLTSGAKYFLHAEFKANAPVPDFCFGALVRDTRGLEIYGIDTHKFSPPIVMPPLHPGDIRTVTMAFHAHLGPGAYFRTLGLARSDEHKYDLRFDALEFAVAPVPAAHTTSLANLHAEFIGL